VQRSHGCIVRWVGIERNGFVDLNERLMKSGLETILLAKPSELVMPTNKTPSPLDATNYFGYAAGSNTDAVVPAPSSLVIFNSPAIPRASWRAIVSPRPTPSNWRVVPRSAWKNGSKT